MKVLRTLMVSAAASALMAGGSFAADLMMSPPAPEAAMTDWSGAYIGVGLAGTQFYSPQVNEIALELSAGFNVEQSGFLFGAEGFLAGYSNDWPDSGFYAGVEGRAGFLAAPEVLVYGSGGALTRTSGNSYWTAGGGLEFMVASDVSLDLEYKHLWQMGGGYQANSVSGTINWHF